MSGINKTPVPLPNPGRFVWPNLPGRINFGRRPLAQQTVLAAAINIDPAPPASPSAMVMGINLSGTTFPLTAALPVGLFGITSGPGVAAPYFLQGSSELLSQSVALPGTIIQSVEYDLNSIVFNPEDMFLYAAANAQNGNQGILRFDQDGNPDGNNQNQFFFLFEETADNGMGLVRGTVDGAAISALVAPLSGVCAVVVSGVGQGPELTNIVPFNDFRLPQMPQNLGMLAPRQSVAGGTVYFPWYDVYNSQNGMGFLSISFSNLATTLVTGNLPAGAVKLVPMINLLPYASSWCVGSINNQDVIYAAPWNFTPEDILQWTILQINPATGAKTLITSPSVGSCAALCLTTVLA